MVWWMQFKKKKNALHSGLPAHIPRLLLLFFLLGFSHQMGAQQHTPAAEKEGRTEKGWGLKERDGEKEKGNSWSDEKESDSYRKAINEYGRLRVSIPTEIFFFFPSSPATRPPVEIMQMGEKEIQQWVDVKCWGPVS